MSDFNLSSLSLEGTAIYDLVHYPGKLRVRSALRDNKKYFNALLKRNQPRAERLRRKGIDVEMIEQNLLEDRDLYPKYVIVELLDVPDENGDIAESSTQSFLLVREGELHAPPTNYVLEGITRRAVLELAEDERIPIRSAPVSKDVLGSLDEAFLAGTSMNVWPVERIDG